MRLAWSALLSLLLVACGGDDDPTSEMLCTPGESRACTCATGASGAQVCAADGAGLGPCECVAGDGGIDGGEPELDAGTRDAGGRRDAGSDAGRDAAGDAGSSCDYSCTLAGESTPTCSGTFESCRITGCTTWCGAFGAGVGHHGDSCTHANLCQRWMQCLRVGGGLRTCRRFCRLEGDVDDCAPYGLDCTRPSSITTPVEEGDVAVMLPPGIGICG